MNNTFETFIPEDGELKDIQFRPPSNVYKPIKRCPNCQSVYLTDTNCEACGRSLLYHPIGEPFSAKSLYGFKERYYESLPYLVKHLPLFENRQGPEAKSYVRKLLKRFDDLIAAFGENEAISSHDRRFFYVETMELIDELLRYGVNHVLLQQKIEGSMESGPMLAQELLFYLNETKLNNGPSKPWKEVVLNHRISGLRVDYILKVILVTATVVALAVGYYDIISSQVGR